MGNIKKKKRIKSKKSSHQIKEPLENLLREEGKFLHGTKGKPNRGPRGNKKY
jgi:hypothetical protein